MSLSNNENAAISLSADGNTILVQGAWTILNVPQLEVELQRFFRKVTQAPHLDGSAITELDSAGALLIQDMLLHYSQAERQPTVTGLSEKHHSLFNLVTKESQYVHHPELPEHKGLGPIATVGQWAVEKVEQTIAFLNFIGELSVIMLKAIANPRRLHALSILATVDESGYQGLPIIALMSFLIGIVLAYQVGLQLEIYGADIYIVDFTGIAILREFGPLITAIVMAGRTSTAFAALIGTMKVNEEIDALSTMGLSPTERLVLPKIIGLLIAMPLLTVWADIFGVFGSMVMAKSLFSLSFHGFLERFQYAIGMKNYILGLLKAPIFALIVSAVGCFQGFQVGTSADSVGKKTTVAAVQAIFLIIVADAGFSILYSWMGL